MFWDWAVTLDPLSSKYPLRTSKIGMLCLWNLRYNMNLAMCRLIYYRSIFEGKVGPVLSLSTEQKHTRFLSLLATHCTSPQRAMTTCKWGSPHSNRQWTSPTFSTGWKDLSEWPGSMGRRMHKQMVAQLTCAALSRHSFGARSLPPSEQRPN